MQISIRTLERNRTAVIFLTCLVSNWCGASEQTANLLANLQADSQASSKSIQAVRTDTPPIIDGRLDESAWQQAAIVEDLHEVSPNEFAPTSEISRFYVLYDDDAIYVAGRLWDSDPENVVAKVLRKGDFSIGEDSISVILDPHNNRRSGYIFDLNPNGRRSEGLYSDVTTENWFWQGIWHGAANMDAKGWVAEFEIPFKTLSFDPSNDTWGLNFSRWRGRTGEVYGWVSHNRTQNPANSGKLQGLVGLDQGLGLDVVPGIRVSENKTFETAETTAYSATDLEPSLDVFYKVTSALTAALTVNTDFSGTSADARQVNLSRFGLFFPEQRNFFLQDTDIFEFGRIGGGDYRTSTTISQVERESGRPFFSRRIGLSDTGEAIDLDVGGKLTGRLGRWEIGVLDIQQASHFTLDSNDNLVAVDSTNLFVGRAAARILAESLIGVMVTKGDPLSDLDNTLIGVDFRYLNTRLASTSIEGAMWYQQTDTEGLDGNNAAFGFSFKVPKSDGFRGAIGFKEIQVDFNPALGFVNRNDVRDYTLEVGHTWRPEGEVIRAIYSGVDTQRINTIAGDLQSQVVNLRMIEVETTSSDQLKLHYSNFREQIVEDFEISDGIFIPSGLYSFDQYCASINTGAHRNLAVNGGFCNGDFYDGENQNAFTHMTWRPNRHLKVSFMYDINDIDLPQGDFITRLTSLRADIAFSTTWFWENFVQYDNVSDSLGVNSILRWLPRAGREMVFVINREFQDYNQTRSFKSESSDIAFKFSYTFRF